jgi:hypothetical protein
VGVFESGWGILDGRVKLAKQIDDIVVAASVNYPGSLEVVRAVGTNSWVLEQADGRTETTRFTTSSRVRAERE